MKKFTALLLTLLMLICLAACGGNTANTSETENDVPKNETTNILPPETALPETASIASPSETTGNSETTAIPKETDAPEETEPSKETTRLEETTDAPIIEEPTITKDSTFEIHFIDVGQADSALILCDGKAMLIDGGNTADSSLIYSYLKSNKTSHLNYIIATHAHEDHVGGLAGALNYATVDNIYCPVKTFDSEAFRDFVKYAEKKNAEIEIPKAGDSFYLGCAKVDILGCNSTSDTNDSSIVLKITYGETSFLFTGDAEREAEQVILNAGYDLTATVLKVGHHGSANSTTYMFLREIMPKYAVISVGCGNSYGHPTEDALSRLRDANVKVYRTDLQGTIICTSDGNNVSFNVSKNADIDTLAPTSTIEQLQDIVKKSVDKYNGSSNKKLAGQLTYNIVNQTEVELTYTASNPLNANEKHLVNEAMEQILDFVLADISASSYSKSSEVTAKITVNYQIYDNETTPPPATTPVVPTGTNYIGNKNTKKFHYTWCSSVDRMKESNKYYYTGTRNEMIAKGYVPCKNCNP